LLTNLTKNISKRMTLLRKCR